MIDTEKENILKILSTRIEYSSSHCKDSEYEKGVRSALRFAINTIQHSDEDFGYNAVITAFAEYVICELDYIEYTNLSEDPLECYDIKEIKNENEECARVARWLISIVKKCRDDCVFITGEKRPADAFITICRRSESVDKDERK